MPGADTRWKALHKEHTLQQVLHLVAWSGNFWHTGHAWRRGWQGHVEPFLAASQPRSCNAAELEFLGAQVTHEHAHELAQPVAAHAQRDRQEHKWQVKRLCARNRALFTAKGGSCTTIRCDMW